MKWVGPKQVTLWFSRSLAKDLDLNAPEDLELWRFLSFQFNEILIHILDCEGKQKQPDWGWVSAQSRKGWSAYGLWESKTGRKKPIDLAALIRVAVALARTYQRIRDSRTKELPQASDPA